MTKVVIKECRNYELDSLMKKINQGVEGLGGWDAFVQPGMKVLLKVNLIGPKPPESGAITHCEFVRGMIRLLKNKDCTVWIGDSSGGAIAGIAPTASSFKVSGLEKVAEEEGAKIKNFDKEGVIAIQPKHTNEEQMYIARPMFEADCVINLPKLKTHTAAIYTGAIKNLFGCIPGLKKAQYHKMAPDPKDFGEIIADINEGVKVNLHIMDAIMCMDGEGPTAGNPYDAGIILMSKDPLALDTVAAQMIGLQMDEIPILQASKDRGIGQSVIENMEIEGDYGTIPILKGFKLPRRFGGTKRRNDKIIIKVIDFLKTRPKVNKKRCKNCNLCVESCPVQAIHKETKAIDYGLCIECMCCHELCSHKAVELKRVNFMAGLLTKLYRGKYR